MERADRQADAAAREIRRLTAELQLSAPAEVVRAAEVVMRTHWPLDRVREETLDEFDANRCEQLQATITFARWDLIDKARAVLTLPDVLFDYPEDD
jgi:hypothetical protein